MNEIKQQIKDLGVKQLWLAYQLEVSSATLNYWLQETRPMPDGKRNKLKTILTKLQNALHPVK